MAGDKKAYPFDEEAKEAASYLLESFWILREREPERYRLVCEREEALRGYFLDKCGFRLFIHRDFVKLEKIPAKPAAWMGIQAFTQPMDYGLFCCVMAFLEMKTVDDQFLLGELCEALKSLYPVEEDGSVALNWDDYSHRKSLVRVLQFSEQIGILRIVDGKSEGFSQHEGHEVLYEVPVIARYFLRAYPKDLFQYDTLEEIVAAGSMEEEQLTGTSRRHRVYRHLFLTPAYYDHEALGEDFFYLRNVRNRLKADIESHTYFQFELHKHAALLTVPEKKAHLAVLPDQRGISDIVLHWMKNVRTRVEDGKLLVGADGRILITDVDFAIMLRECRDETGEGWSKAYRDMSEAKLIQEVKDELASWKMIEEDAGALFICQAAGRLFGRYPSDYEGRKRDGHE